MTNIDPDTADVETVPTRVREAVIGYDTIDVTETRVGYRVPVPGERIELLDAEKQHPAEPWHDCRLYI